MIDFEELVKKKSITEEEIIINIKEKKEKKERKYIIKKEEKRKKIEKEINSIINFKEEDENFKNIYLFTFDNFSEYYLKNLRAIINREQEDDKETFSKIKTINRQYKRYKRNNYFLSQKILNIYITFTNNNLEELLKTFKLIKCENKMSEKEKFKNLEIISSTNIINNRILNNIISKTKNSSEEMQLIKDEGIYYFYILKNKYSNDKILKEKYFGTFDNIEIANIIEDNFILERYFSSYTLFKYSLLNVLAVTREIESKVVNNKDVVKIICDFCDLTKLVDKKYMNIYLNIFKEIYQNNEHREKFQIKECLNMISIYFRKQNLNLSEENDKFLNKLKEQIDSLETIPNNYNFIEYVSKHGKFFEMSESFFSSNKRFKFENSLKAIETIYIGKYDNKMKDQKLFDFNYKELSNLFNEKKDNKNKKFLPKTPILLYDNTNKILKKYLTNFSKENISYNDLYDDILSLLFYFKIPMIEDKWIENSKRKENNEGNNPKTDKKKNMKKKQNIKNLK